MKNHCDTPKKQPGVGTLERNGWQFPHRRQDFSVQKSLRIGTLIRECFQLKKIKKFRDMIFFSKLKILKSVEKNCRLSVRIFKAISMAPDRNVPVGHRLAYIILYIRQTVSGWYIFVSPEQTWNFGWYIPENVPIRAGTFSRILGGAGIFCLERCANYADTGQTFKPLFSWIPKIKACPKKLTRNLCCYS